MSVAQSLTSEVKQVLDHKCMCQICVCNQPNHKCPINHSKALAQETAHQKEFQGHNQPKPDLWGARDNLKFQKQLDRDPTEYQKEYIAKFNDPKKVQISERFKEITKDVNMESHIKNQVGNAKDMPMPNFNEKFYNDNPRQYRPQKFGPNGEPIERPKNKGKSMDPTYGTHEDPGSNYFQPRKWNHPKVKKDQLDQKEVPRYQMDYNEQDPNKYHKAEKLVYDNLVSGGAEPKNQPHYKHEFIPKSNVHFEPRQQEHKINRNKNNYAMPINKNHPGLNLDGKGHTHYQRKFDHFRQNKDVCPINKLPQVPLEMRNRNQHLIYRKSLNNWKAK